MGFGDAIMASALVRGFHARGKLAAFFSPDGNHRTIKWTGVCEDILKHNPNVARPGQENEKNLVWMAHYKKVFVYARYDGHQRRWLWDRKFRPSPGEFFFGPEDRIPDEVEKPFVFIEPNVAWQRAANINKDWGDGKYEELAKALIDRGHMVVQCIHGNSRRRLPGARCIPTPLFRQAARIMSQARLIIAPEGGNHHAAAALGVPAIILWGDWSPHSMGYDDQIKFGPGTEACGIVDKCQHCRATFDRITVEEVFEAATGAMHG
jgi:ADP-heptose:LPS heptosyltransferase